jgi:hypothetical protein
MKLKILLFLISFLSLFNLSYSQFTPNGCLTDVYMGAYGFWDYQSTGSLQSVEQDYNISTNYNAIFLTADSVLSNPVKRVLYFFSSDNGNNWVHTQVSNYQASFPSLALQTDGRAIICFYDSTASRIRVFRSQSSGSLIFDSLSSPPGNGGEYPKMLYYNNYLIMFAVFPGSPYNQIKKNRYNFLTGSWESWQNAGVNNGTSSYQAAKSVNGKLGICWIGDSTFKRVKYIESLDSGSTFGTTNTIFSEEITGGDTVRPFNHIDMVYYPGIGDLPCITFDGIARILPAGGQPGVRKYYHNPKIYFWNQNVGVITVADTNNYFYGGIPGRNTVVSMGAGWSPLCGPAIGYSSSSLLYIMYSGTVMSNPPPYNNYWYDSDLFGIFSNSGSTWNPVPGHIPGPTEDARHVSMVKRNLNFAEFAVVYQRDLFPGSYRLGDTTAITRAYPEFNRFFTFIHVVHVDKLRLQYFLFQNYPNPFNSSTKIEFGIQKAGHVVVKIYNAAGKQAAILGDQNLLPANYAVFFNGTNFPSGIYFYTLYVDGALTDTKKMVLVK